MEPLAYAIPAEEGGTFTSNDYNNELTDRRHVGDFSYANIDKKDMRSVLWQIILNRFSFRATCLENKLDLLIKELDA